jgi:hypothetical protein
MSDTLLAWLTYIQLTLVEAAMVWMLWNVRKWITQFGPYLEGFVKVLGEKAAGEDDDL